MHSKIGLFNFCNSNDNISPLFPIKNSTTTRTIQHISEIKPSLTLINTFNPLKS